METGRDGFFGAAERASPPPPQPSCSFLGSAAATTGSGGAQMLSFSSSGAAGETLQRKYRSFFLFTVFFPRRDYCCICGALGLRRALSDLSPALIDCLLMGHGHGHGALLQKPLPLGSCREQKGAHVHYSPPFCFCNPRQDVSCPQRSNLYPPCRYLAAQKKLFF